MPCWYWLADCGRAEPIAFVLGHAWAMHAVHGAKTTCDRKDADAMARLLKGGNFPPAYAYPRERRGLRDLRRSRLRLVRQRAELYGHVHPARRQAKRPPVASAVKYPCKRAACTADSNDPFVRRRVATHRALLEPLDTALRRREAEIEDAARGLFPVELAVWPSTPGVGPVLARTILLDIDTSDRFDRRQQCCSSARRCGAVPTSANKRCGGGNAKAGNAWRKWAFAEAAVLSAQKDERIGAYLKRLAARLGKAKAYAALAPKLGRAC